MRKLFFLVLVGSLFSVAGTGFAQTDPSLSDQFDRLRSENAELRERIEMLERNLQDLSTKLDKAPTPAPAPAPEKKGKPAEKPSMKSKYDIDMYGYVKLDSSVDSSRSETGNFMKWVYPENVNGGDRQYSMTANQTRFGFKFAGPTAGNAKVSGNVELEGYGPNGTENKGNIGIRHAYFQVDWPKSDFQLLGGQTSDVISPLFPSTLNYSVAWWAGNIGVRRAQLRLTKGIKLGEKSKLTLQGAAGRVVGDVGPFTRKAGDSGEDSGSPSFQGRVAVSFPTFKKLQGAVGFSGHTSEEEYDFNAAGLNKRIKSRSNCWDVSLPICDWLGLKGETWHGQNVDDYFGGIGQGILVSSTGSGTVVNATGFGGTFQKAEAIEGKGGWVEASFGPFKNWRFSLGCSSDDPDDRDLPASARTKNSARWFTVLHDLNEAVQIGVELSKWKTSYKNGTNGENNRFQTSLIYKF